MKSVLILISSFLLAGTVHGSALLKPRANDGYVQNPSGSASFTCYSGCSAPGKPPRWPSMVHTLNLGSLSVACGKTASGYTAAMNQLSFGAPPSGGGGDACGRCFRITGEADPYSSGDKGPFNCIVVKVTDLCPGGPSNQWCGQTVSNPVNSFGMSVQCVFFRIFSLCFS